MQKVPNRESRAKIAASTPPPIPDQLGAARHASTTATVSTVAEVRGEPRKYRPGMGRVEKKDKQGVGKDDFVPYVPPVALASRGSRLMGVIIDGFALWLCLWLLGAVFLPKGLSLFDITDFGMGSDDYSTIHDDPAFEAKLTEIENNYYNTEDASWEEYEEAMEELEKEWQETAGVHWDAGDRWAMGSTTAEDLKVILGYFVIAAAFVLIFSCFQSLRV